MGVTPIALAWVVDLPVVNETARGMGSVHPSKCGGGVGETVFPCMECEWLVPEDWKIWCCVGKCVYAVLYLCLLLNFQESLKIGVKLVSPDI